MEQHNLYRESRPWGEFIEFTRNEPTTVKIIIVKPNEALSLQTHAKRSEFWFIISGTGSIQKGEEKIPAAPGDTFMIPVGTAHRISADTELKVLEISSGEFDEADITRLDDKYGRTIISENGHIA